ncbi:hypothetical protein ZWY2020_040460 [Hordeum vulgare]|nr:hypothetical protein ZWY2020_040460 [Hordeum vulgare]
MPERTRPQRPSAAKLDSMVFLVVVQPARRALPELLHAAATAAEPEASQPSLLALLVGPAAAGERTSRPGPRVPPVPFPSFPSPSALSLVSSLSHVFCSGVQNRTPQQWSQPWKHFESLTFVASDQ